MVIIQKGVERFSRSNDTMELEKIVNDTREISERIYSPEVLGPWNPCALIVDLVGETGTLAQSILTVEGIAPAAPERGHLTADIPRALYMLVNLADVYGVDLGQAWNDLMEEGQGNIARLASQIEDAKQA